MKTQSPDVGRSKQSTGNSDEPDTSLATRRGSVEQHVQNTHANAGRQSQENFIIPIGMAALCRELPSRTGLQPRSRFFLIVDVFILVIGWIDLGLLLGIDRFGGDPFGRHR